MWLSHPVAKMAESIIACIFAAEACDVAMMTLEKTTFWHSLSLICVDEVLILDHLKRGPVLVGTLRSLTVVPLAQKIVVT